jgi:hypothetical protein
MREAIAAGWSVKPDGRSRLLAAPLADRPVNPEPAPADADQVLAPMRWLLDHAAEGAALTTTGNLARPLVAEGCRRFDWLTLTGNPAPRTNRGTYSPSATAVRS